MADWGKVLSRGEVEDRRGLSPAVGGITITGVALLLLFNYLSGGDITDVINQIPTTALQQSQQSTNSQEFAGEDQYEIFASKVLGSNNDFFAQKFKEEKLIYDPPKLVLFRGATTSGCGTATSQIGPHYCTLDKTIYLDETFFEELTQRLGAKGGDVAQAYVISHEVGHHIQNQTGFRGSSVDTELQADCLSGLWSGSLKNLGILSPGEIDEAMDAAAVIYKNLLRIVFCQR